MRTIEIQRDLFGVSEERSRQRKQLNAVFEYMRGGEWRTLRMIADACGCSETSASARLRDIRKAPPLGFGLRVKKVKDANVRGLWWYKVGE